MKLYTEDEVRRIIKIAFWQDFENGTTEEDIIAKAHSINLPSDEEIDKESFIVNPLKLQNDYSKYYYDDNIQYREEWVDGAKWVINKINQQSVISDTLSK
jgi:hypothetical protein